MEKSTHISLTLDGVKWARKFLLYTTTFRVSIDDDGHKLRKMAKKK